MLLGSGIAIQSGSNLAGQANSQKLSIAQFKTELHSQQ